MTEYASQHLMPGDRALRRDVRLMGWQLRRLVLDHGEADLWESLSRLRDAAERRQRGDADAEGEIVALIREAPRDRLAAIIRAVGMFFDLANLAEDRHRVRVLNRRAAEGRQSETIELALRDLREQGMEDAAVRELVASLEIEPVFTAHPTEAKRRTVRRTLRRLRRDLYLLDGGDLTRRARRERLTRMQRDLLALWSTDADSARKPTVAEELRRTLFAARTLWEVGPKIIQQLRRAADPDAPPDAGPAPLRFGNWIGGDRDGNPFVTCDVTRSTLRRLRAAAIGLHRRAGRAVRRRLTLAATRCPLPDWLHADVEAARKRWPQLNDKLDQLHPDEWIVHWLVVIDQRLRHSTRLPGEDPHPMAYTRAQQLAEDIEAVARALRESSREELIAGALSRWLDRARMFGLHLLRLDIRVHSNTIRDLTAELLAASGQHADYAGLDDAGRRAAVNGADVAALASAPIDRFSGPSADLLHTLGLVHRVASAAGPEAFGGFVVSMTHQPGDIVAVAGLMRIAAARCGQDDPAPIPIAPLFETIDDLDRAEPILESLIDDPGYRRHLDRCGGRAMVMVGYSDSAKDGGYVASNWALYRAQARLAALTQRHGVRLTVFHGRGGALGRGGGPAARAILSLPPEAVDGRLRLTEQGEVIAERYDDPAVAHRHLEQLIWATIRQTHRRSAPLPDEQRQRTQRFADDAMAAYRAFVGDPRFEDYLRQCTGLPLIESLRIGSRPSRRTGGAKVEDLRAIPFTFAWNQVRAPINAFFGLGAAYELMDADGRAAAGAWYATWPWFRAVIDNAELALARCDMAITRRYADLADDPATAGLCERLQAEHEAAQRAVFAIKGIPQLLATTPWLQRTIRVRNPYLDLINLIQVELLAQRKQNLDEGERAAVDDVLRLSVQAIAAGLRNTG